MPNLQGINAVNSPFFGYWNSHRNDKHANSSLEQKMLSILNVLENMHAGDHVIFKKDGTVKNYGHLEAKMIKKPGQFFKQIGRNIQYQLSAFFSRSTFTFDSKSRSMENIYGFLKTVDRYCQDHPLRGAAHDKLVEGLNHLADHLTDDDLSRDKRLDGLEYSDFEVNDDGTKTPVTLTLRQKLKRKIHKTIAHEDAAVAAEKTKQGEGREKLVIAVWRDKDLGESEADQYYSFMRIWSGLSETEKDNLVFGENLHFREYCDEILEIVGHCMNLDGVHGPERKKIIEAELAFMLVQAEANLRNRRGHTEDNYTEGIKRNLDEIDQKLTDMTFEVQFVIEGSEHKSSTKQHLMEEKIAKVFPRLAKIESDRRLASIKKYGELSPKAARRLKNVQIAGLGIGGAMLGVMACVAPGALSKLLSRKSATMIGGALEDSELTEKAEKAFNGMGKKGVEAAKAALAQVEAEDIVSRLKEKAGVEIGVAEVQQAIAKLLGK